MLYNLDFIFLGKMAKTKKKTATEKQTAKRRECKKLSMRREREKLKENPDLLEEARRKDRERKKQQRKNIDELSNRDKRQQRKKWRKYSRTYRANVKNKEHMDKVLEDDTPPHSPGGLVGMSPPSTSRKDSGKKVRRRERRKLRKELEDLKRKNEKLMDERCSEV